MATYHLRMQTISRGKGRSATGAAAYRNGARYVDARTGRTHDYRRRTDVLATGLVGWRGTPQALWSAAEAAERRRDAVVAREAVVALPRELDAAIWQQAAQMLCRAIHERWEVAATFAVHDPPRRAGRPLGCDDPDAAPEETEHHNPHAHVMWTTRIVQEDGSLGRKTRILDNVATGSAEVAWLRETWAGILNALLGVTCDGVQVDHRSLTARHAAGELTIEQAVPQLHLGPVAAALERKGVRTRRGAFNRKVRRLAREAAALDREIAEAERALAAEAAARPLLPAPTAAPPPPARRRTPRSGPPPELMPEPIPVPERQEEPEEVPVAWIASAAPNPCRARLLARHYGRDLPRNVVGLVRWVDDPRCAGEPLRALLRDGARVADHGARITASGDSGQAARLMVAMAMLHGWAEITLGGTEPMLGRLWLEAQRQGVRVAGYVPPPAVRRAWEAAAQPERVPDQIEEVEEAPRLRM